MRTLFVTLCTLAVTLVLGLTVVVARVFRVPQGAGSIYDRCLRTWARTVNWAAGVRVEVYGADHLRQTHGAVFISNHVSWFDIFPLAQTLPWCSFVAKQELRRIPLFGVAAECAGVVFVDRDNRKAAFESYKDVAREVQRGRAVVVCPEGTRGRDYHLRPFKKGPFVLAIASQLPVVPTVVYGAREIMPKGSFRIRPGVVEIHFLAPVPTAGYDYEARTELMTVVWTRMADELRARFGVETAEHPIANAQRAL